VAKISACTELANIPRIITGKGINTGTSKQKTDTTISSATTFPKSRKLSDSGFEKSSNILIGKKKRRWRDISCEESKPFFFKSSVKITD